MFAVNIYYTDPEFYRQTRVFLTRKRAQEWADIVKETSEEDVLAVIVSRVKLGWGHFYF